MIKELFVEAMSGYISDKRKYDLDIPPRTFSRYRSNEIIKNELPNQIQILTKLPSSKYKLEGSIGKGKFSDVPWICIFDTDITKSAQTGYYIVLLFHSKMKGVYLSLNQGWNQYLTEFGTGPGISEITKNVYKCRTLLRSISNYDIERINLESNSILANGYEAGNICSKFYPINNFPEDDEMINDINNFNGLYRELKGLVGTNILGISEINYEEEFQEKIQTGHRKNPPEGPIQKKIKNSTTVITIWPRDRNMAYTALDNANFKCENDNKHQTFLSAKNGKTFQEAHHLIPIQFQDDFEVSIDVPENIICLCPICHRAFHNAENKYKLLLINKFYLMRKDLLSIRGIVINEEKLLFYYKSLEE